MGQAKLRGTFEERKAKAVERVTGLKPVTRPHVNVGVIGHSSSSSRVCAALASSMLGVIMVAELSNPKGISIWRGTCDELAM
jgi:hypothetical protein